MPYVRNIGFKNYKPMFSYCYQTIENMFQEKEAESCRVMKDRKINSSCEDCEHCKSFIYSSSEIVCDVIVEASEIAEQHLKENEKKLNSTISFLKEYDEEKKKVPPQKSPEEIKLEEEAQKRLDERAEAYNESYKEYKRLRDGFYDIY
jgi:hypothetical protein